MATRLGNYVTLPGTSTNWASGISDSLANLSKNYFTQGENELERERLAQAREEDKRRFEIKQAFDEKQAQDTANWRKAEQDRLKEAAEYTRKKDQEKENALTAARKTVWDISNKDLTLDALPGVIGETYSKTIDRVTKDQDATRDFLLNPDKDPSKATEAFRNNLAAEGLKGAALDKAVAERQLALQGFQDELEFTGNEEDRKKRVDEFINQQYKPILSAIDKNIRKGVGLTKEQIIDAKLALVDPKLYSTLSRDEILESIKKSVTAPTRKELETQAQASAKAADEQQKTQLDLIDKYYQRLISQNKTGDSKGFSLTSSNVSKALNDLGDLKNKVGSMDAKDVQLAFDRMVQEGVNPELATAAIASTLDDAWYGANTIDPASEEFAKLLTSVKGIQAGANASKGGRISINKDAYVFKPTTPVSVDRLLLNSITVPKVDRNIDVNKDFALESRVGTGIRPSTASGDLGVGSGAAIAASRALPPGPTVGGVPNTITPVPNLSSSSSASAVLPEVIDVKNLRTLLEPNAYKTGKSFEASKEALDLARSINKDINFLNRPGRNSGVGLTNPSVLRVRNDLANKTKRLEELKRQLIAPK